MKSRGWRTSNGFVRQSILCGSHHRAGGVRQGLRDTGILVVETIETCPIEHTIDELRVVRKLEIVARHGIERVKMQWKAPGHPVFHHELGLQGRARNGGRVGNLFGTVEYMHGKRP